MTRWNETFLNKLRAYWKGMIDKIQLQTGESTWTDLEIVEKTIEGNAIAVFCRVPDVQFTAVNIRVIDSDGDVAGVTPESISKTDSEGFYLIFRFDLRQEG